MWPRHVDMNPEECAATLRRLELAAYSGVVSALRAQGDLTKERRKTLTDLSSVLNISVERHKTEIRRALNDETLATVARCVAGTNCENDWAREGRRIIPLMRRAVPVTAFCPAADAAGAAAARHNAELPTPLRTRTQPPPPPIARKKGGASAGPPNLRDILTEKDGVARVNQPPVSVPARGGKWGLPMAPDDFGDVIILPSGMAIRFKEEAPDRSKDDIDPRSASDESANESRANPKKSRRKRKTQGQDEEPDVKGTYEVIPPGMLFPPPSMMGPGGQGFPYPHTAMGPPPPPGTSAPGQRAAHPTPKKRRSRAKNPKAPPVQNPSAAASNLPPGTSGLHGYARPFLPKSPKPLHELEGTVPSGVSNSTAAVSKMPQLPRVPVPVSPRKINQAMQRMAAAAAASATQGNGGGGGGTGTARKLDLSLTPPPSSSPSATATSSSSAEGASVSEASPTATGAAAPTVATVPTSAIATSPISSLGGVKIVSPGGTTKHLLPKGVASVSTGASFVPPAAGTPIYMVTSPSPRVLTTSAAASPVGTTQRVVTVSAAALKAGAAAAAAGSPVAAAGGSAVLPGQKTTTVYRTLSAPGGGQRTFLAAGSPNVAGASPGGNRPSVIVVQRTPMTSKALAAAASAGGATTTTIVGSPGGILPGAPGQRILTKGGKPLVIVSKPALAAAGGSGVPGTAPILVTTGPPPAAPAAAAAAGAPTAVVPTSTSAPGTPVEPAVAVTQPEGAAMVNTSQAPGNVIVLDVNQDQVGAKSNVLSDILQATGIMQEGQQEQQEQEAGQATPMEVDGISSEATTVPSSAAEEVVASGETAQIPAAVAEPTLVALGPQSAADVSNHHLQDGNSTPTVVVQNDNGAPASSAAVVIGDSNSSPAESGSAAVSSSVPQQDAAYLKSQKAKTETVLPPCAPPEMVMPVGSTAGAGSAGSAVSARNGSEEAAPTEAEKASCSGGGAEGESLEDISSFIQETSAKEIGSK